MILSIFYGYTRKFFILFLCIRSPVRLDRGLRKTPCDNKKHYFAKVYVDEEYENPEVLVWAIKLGLQPEEIVRIEN